jgi:hypothetical protein
MRAWHPGHPELHVVLEHALVEVHAQQVRREVVCVSICSTAASNQYALSSSMCSNSIVSSTFMLCA